MDKAINDLKNHVSGMTYEGLVELAATALFHLRCMSGSRNSFSAEYTHAAYIAGIGYPARDKQVDEMHRQAAKFIMQNDLR